jgi:hypothetical protein
MFNTQRRPHSSKEYVKPTSLNSTIVFHLKGHWRISKFGVCRDRSLSVSIRRSASQYFMFMFSLFSNSGKSTLYHCTDRIIQYILWVVEREHGGLQHGGYTPVTALDEGRRLNVCSQW